MLNKNTKLLNPKLFQIIIYLGVFYFVNSTFAAEPKTKIGLPVKLNQVLPYAGILKLSISEFKVSEDGKWVVYAIKNDANPLKNIALFAVKINGGRPIRIDNGNDWFDTKIENFVISPDSSRVIYSSYIGENSLEVFSFSLQNSSRVKLIRTPRFYKISFPKKAKFSANGSHIVLLVSYNSSQKAYSVPVAGGSLKLLTGVLGVSSGHVVGDNFVFEASRDSYYSVSIKNGGTPRLLFDSNSLKDPTNIGGTFSIYRTDMHPGGLYGLFQVRDSTPRRDFYSFPINGGRPIKLASFPEDEFSDSDLNYLFGSNNKVYIVVTKRGDFSQIDGGYGTKIYSISMANGSSSVLADMPNLYVGARSAFLSDNNSNIVMEVSNNRFGYHANVYSLSTANGNIYRLSNSFSGTEYLHITPDSKEVIYALNDFSRRQGKYFSQLFRVNINGQGAPRLFGSMMTSVNHRIRIRKYNSKISKDGSRIIFCANVDRDDVYQLYHLAISKDQSIRGEQDKLTPDRLYLYNGSSCGRYQINSASTHVVFLAKSPTNRVELFSQRVAPNGIVMAPIISLLLDDEPNRP